jgi:hypothetical protein
MSEPSRQELENQLRKLLADAKIRLEIARNHVRKVQCDLKSGALPPAEGRYAHHRALQAETLALDHYQHVLKTLSDLVLTGKIPDEQDRP